MHLECCECLEKLQDRDNPIDLIKVTNQTFNNFRKYTFQPISRLIKIAQDRNFFHDLINKVTKLQQKKDAKNDNNTKRKITRSNDSG